MQIWQRNSNKVAQLLQGKCIILKIANGFSKISLSLLPKELPTFYEITYVHHVAGFDIY